MSEPPLSFTTPALLAAALLLVAVIVVLGVHRRIQVPRLAIWLGIGGLAMLALAAGGPAWRRPIAGDVAVMVDLSPSTRTASYRDRAALRQRIDQLLAGTPHRVYFFSGGALIADDGRPLNHDLPAEQTQYLPPPAPAVVLFSDGRFPLPQSAPRTFAVVDTALLAAADGRVDALRADGRSATAHLLTADARMVAWTGVTPDDEMPIDAGSRVLRRPISPGATRVSVRLSAGDSWPENDQLLAHPPPPAEFARWYVTRGAAAPPGYVAMSPADLPGEAAPYLGVALIVLENIAAADLSVAARQRIAAYAQDLGGGVVIAGGDRAFAAGGYVNTPIERISPLASVPPRPATHWLLLTDGSGSMNAPADAARGTGGTRWQAAVAALGRALPTLPPEDPVTIGSFAADVAWWSSARPAAATASLPLPPPGVSPTGPTNLVPAIREAAGRHDPALPGHLLLLTDADAEVPDPPALAALLRERNLRLHLLATDEGRGLAALSQVAVDSGGQVVRQEEAGRWAEAMAEMLSAAGERHLVTAPVNISFADLLATLPARSATPWNRTWLKPGATELARSVESEQTPLAAVWQVGQGRVAAVAFALSPAELARLADDVARPPRDPRFNVSYSAGSTLRVQVDAADPAAAQPYLNDRVLTLELTGEGMAPERHEIPQTAPGRYELELPAPRSPRLAAVLEGGRPIERFAVAGRYAPEFDAVGVDRSALESLARQSGGRVIEPNESRPIEFRWPRRQTALTPWVASLGALLVLGALVAWKRA